MSAPFAWWPNAEAAAESTLAAFIAAAGLPDFDALARRADADPAWFWGEVLRFFDLRFYKPFDRLMDDSAGPAWTRWCIGGTTNIVLNCFDRHRGTAVFDRVYLVWNGEDGAERTLTYREFDREVCRLAGALRRLGCVSGDVIGLFMPNVPETYIAYFAALKIGAVLMPLFSGFAAQPLAERLNLGGAKVLITTDGALRRGRIVPMKAVADEAAAATPSLRHTIVHRRCGLEIEWTARDHDWAELVSAQPDDAPTEELEAEAPAVLLFTSGSTGRPKGCVYTHVGFAAKMLVDGMLLTDFKASDRYFWMVDMGWAVASFAAVTPALIGGSVLIAEGAPDYPEPDRIFALIAKYEVTYAGLVPTIVRAAMGLGAERIARHDFARLRICITGGESWSDRPWLWLKEHVTGERVPIFNASGGTEIGGAILTCTLLHPLKPSSLSVALPGLGVDILDQAGRPVGPGEVGELVMRNPSLSLTKGLWNEPERYIETYWSRFPGLWQHGDLCSRDEDGLWYVHGRSDDTLKIAGKRTGPAEIESVVMESGRVAEVAAVGIPHEIKGDVLAIVCTPMPGETPSEELRRSLTALIEAKLGRSYRPEAVHFCRDLPKTRSMKIVRRAVRAALLGASPGDLSAVANPESLDAIARLVERKVPPPR
ncbi:MAG TPA: AMP-binding protein [Kiloniellales bacterium]|nr:AMP-binding protein [Kiloniellales bacterium]